MRPLPDTALRALRRLVRGERGALLMEALVAVSVFTLLGSAVMTGLSATGNAAQRIEVGATAENLASNQIETILAAAYQDPPYTFSTLPAPTGYTVSAQALEQVPGDDNIAKIVVTVYRDGVAELVVESLRLKDQP